jgi:membrane-associated phospholipid phosphatase
LRQHPLDLIVGVAARRVLLLAHYPSDVIGGLALGAGIDAAVGKAISDQ